MRLRPTALALTLLCALPAFAGGLGDMTADEKTAFRAEVRAYLLENPEVLMEAMAVLRAKDEATAAARDETLAATFQEQLHNDPASYVGGNLQGDLTIVEFVDYRCGYCRKAHEEVAELVKSDGNIRLILKEFPILGEESIVSSRFAIAVLQLSGPEAYAKAHDALIALRGTPDAPTLARLATELGLDAEAVLARMNTDDVSSVIAANHALGEQMEITGTPTFVLGETLLRGYLPLEDMRELVKEERG